MEIKVLEEKDFKNIILNEKGKVLVDFYADWCGPCKMLSPVVEEVAGEKEDVSFYKINVDNAEDISREYGVMSIPTLILFENGNLINKSVGLLSKDELIKFIDNE